MRQKNILNYKFYRILIYVKHNYVISERPDKHAGEIRFVTCEMYFIYVWQCFPTCCTRTPGVTWVPLEVHEYDIVMEERLRS